MINKLKYILLIIGNVSVLNTRCQIPDLNDFNWNLKLYQGFGNEQEFNTNFIKGWTGLNSLCHGSVCELQIYQNSNVLINSGICDLVVKKEDVWGKVVDYAWNDLLPTDTMSDGNLNYRLFNYTSGSIRSLEKHHYGYYEINCKLPKGKGFWPAFWVHAEWDCGYGHEIDILEPNGAQMELALEYTANNHATVPILDSCIENPGAGLVQLTTPMSDGFFSYSCEWLPNSINYYYNSQNEPVRRYRGQNVPITPRWIYVNVAVDPFENNKPNQQTPFPSKMEIDYIKHYTLKTDCQINIIQSNFNFISHNYSLKKSYHLTNSVFPTNSKQTLRMTDYVILDGEFSVPIGSEFAIIPTPCP